jgi:Na+-translocating ferredoxin:NAD+ oxidoreductase RnfG subunit
LTLHRLPRSYRVLYVAIAALLAAAVLSHWWRLALRQGATPGAVWAWYRGEEAAMLFPRAAIEVADDAWMNLFHHTLAMLVLGGLLVRTDARPRAKAAIAALFGAGTLLSALGPPLVWWGVPGSAGVYVCTLALLSGLGLAVLWLVARDALARDARSHRGLPGTDILARAGTAVVLLALVPSVGCGQQLMSERQAIGKVFPAAHWVVTDTIVPDSAVRATLERQLSRPLYEPDYVFRRVYGEEGKLLGYALVTEERGKYRPITMLIGVDTTHRVAGVQVLVYREPRGGEVSREYFLRQYRGKSVGDPIRLNRDIINISGATISVQSVNAAVKKTLVLVNRYYVAPHATPHAPRPLDSLP